MADLQELQSNIKKFIEERDWRQFHTPKDMAISLSLEAAELLEHFQWKSNDDVTEYLKSHTEDVADELADVLYWVLTICLELNIDPVEAGLRKLKKSEKKYPVEKSRGNNKKYNQL